MEFKNSPRNKYVELVCKQMIPYVAKHKLAKFVDIFCDNGAFTAEDTARVFESATKNGLGVRAHVCQLSETALWPLLQFHPASFDHMDHVNEDDIAQLAKRNTVATLVPGANYFLGLEKYPPARKLVDAGARFAGTGVTSDKPAATKLIAPPYETAQSGNMALTLRVQQQTNCHDQ